MDKTNNWENELNLLTEILDKSGLKTEIKWGAPIYVYKGKNIVGHAGFKNHFTLWFYNGVFLKDAYKVLVSAQDKTKSLRQWRFTSADEIDEKKILEYVKEAVEVEEKGLKLKPAKFQPVTLNDLLKDAFKNDKNLKSAFEKLTPGKQKEYILYINESKQEKTKLTRLEKIKPLILEGKGLNDKYK